MLDPVALHQTRFNTPGVLPDGRGVLLGKLAALLFPSVDALVGFFRIFGEEASLDEILPKLRIDEVRAPTGGRQLLVFFHAASSYLVDRAARIAGLTGGLSFTGSGKHFVRYRDARSPLGYDARQLSAEATDYLLYDTTFSLALARVRELPFAQLVFRLSPRALPGLLDPELERDQLWLLSREGLARPLLGYLWRNQIRAVVALVDGVAPQDVTSFAARPRWMIARLEDLPDRSFELFRSLPGVELYQQVGERSLVEVGYRHPIRLDACASIFESDKLYVFSGSRDAVEIVAAPELVPVHTLVERGFSLEERKPAVALASRPANRITVPLRLEPAEVGDRMAATLVPWNKVGWLRRLVYAAPQRLLQSARIAPLDDGLFIMSDEGLSAVPMGQPFWRVAPGVLVPIGHRLEPAVAEEVLSEHVGATSARLVVFPLPIGSQPFALEMSALLPLGRSALERISLDERAVLELPAERGDRERVQVEHGDGGLFPLWGFRDDGAE
jgi:hypothetical protein